MAMLIPLVISAMDDAERNEVRDEVRRLKMIWDEIKLEEGVYPEPEVGNTLTWDATGTKPGLLNNIAEKYSFSISTSRLNDEKQFVDHWNDPIQYVKGDYKNRIPKAAWDDATNKPQDTNKPIGDPTVDIASESDWNPDNKGAFAYIWSYGGEVDNEEAWIY